MERVDLALALSEATGEPVTRALLALRYVSWDAGAAAEQLLNSRIDREEDGGDDNTGTHAPVEDVRPCPNGCAGGHLDGDLQALLFSAERYPSSQGSGRRRGNKGKGVDISVLASLPSPSADRGASALRLLSVTESTKFLAAKKLAGVQVGLLGDLYSTGADDLQLFPQCSHCSTVGTGLRSTSALIAVAKWHAAAGQVCGDESQRANMCLVVAPSSHVMEGVADADTEGGHTVTLLPEHVPPIGAGTPAVGSGEGPTPEEARVLASAFLPLGDDVVFGAVEHAGGDAAAAATALLLEHYEILGPLDEPNVAPKREAPPPRPGGKLQLLHGSTLQATSWYKRACSYGQTGGVLGGGPLRGNVGGVVDTKAPADAQLRHAREQGGFIFSEHLVKNKVTADFEKTAVTGLRFVASGAMIDRLNSRWATLEQASGKKIVPVLCYHGTAVHNIQKIIATGLKVGGSGVKIAHGAAQGTGIYLAINPQTSMSYCCDKKLMFICVALVGSSCVTSDNGAVLVINDPLSVCVLGVVRFASQRD